MGTFGSLKSAEFVSGRFRYVVKYQVYKRPVGKWSRIPIPFCRLSAWEWDICRIHTDGVCRTMPVTDPIADLLTRVRNAIHVRKDEVRVRSSKIVVSILETLKDEGFIDSFEVVPSPLTKVQNDILVRLKYGRGGELVINRIDRVSKPGRRIYQKTKELKPVLRGLGIMVLSTPKGVMSDRQARKANVGGEVLCRIE